MLAQNFARSERLQCMANLRWVGRAFHIWGVDHQGRLPWRVPSAEGGTALPNFGVKAGNTWYEVASISNELVSPKHLVCPSDLETKRVARDFSNQADGGFVHFNYRNNAVSYFVSLDVFPEIPATILAGDRDVRVNRVNVFCSANVANADDLSGLNLIAEWTNGVHRASGNVLLNDGRVEETTTEGLRNALLAAPDNGSQHILIPR